MKKTLLALMLLAGSVAFGQISVGISIGQPPPPRVLRVQPASPGAGYMWVDGYWYPSGKRYNWHQGYWTRPPYQGAVWSGPRYDGQQYFNGYWSGGQNQQPVMHDHRWDRDRRNRDYDRDDRGNGNRQKNGNGQGNGRNNQH